MELNLKDKYFLICGASSGFGRAVAESLIAEGAKLIVVARNKSALEEFSSSNKHSILPFDGDLREEVTIEKLFNSVDLSNLTGAFINAGGPPAMNFMETSMKDWDDSYKSLIRWKVFITKKLVPIFQEKQYGRLLFLESASVKQPIDNLILSNSMRMAVVGMVKSLSQDLAAQGITLNILAPGYHETNAVKRLIDKKAEDEGISYEKAKEKITSGIPVGNTGIPADFASLATWLLSEKSSYITGQTITVDGGIVKYVFG